MKRQVIVGVSDRRHLGCIGRSLRHRAEKAAGSVPRARSKRGKDRTRHHRRGRAGPETGRPGLRTPHARWRRRCKAWRPSLPQPLRRLAAPPPILVAQAPAPAAQAPAAPAPQPPAAAKPAAAPAPQAAAPPPAAPPPKPVACTNPNAMGLARTVEIDTTGGPGFGSQHFKTYDFLRDHEVVLTFDDGPWLNNTQAVLKALADQCLRATFFSIGKHATYYPEILHQVVAAGHTIGSHTWSHADLQAAMKKGGPEAAKEEIEKGASAVHLMAGVPIAPFFRFPDLRQPPEMVTYLGERNIAELLDRHRFLGFQDQEARRAGQIPGGQAHQGRQGHPLDARLPEGDLDRAAANPRPVAEERLQGRSHGAEGHPRHHPAIRRGQSSRRTSSTDARREQASRERSADHQRGAVATRSPDGAAAKSGVAYIATADPGLRDREMRSLHPGYDALPNRSAA